MSAKRPESKATEQPPITPRLAHSIPEVAAMLGTHKATIWRMIAAGQLPVIHIGPNGGLTRIPDVAVQALLQGKAA